MPEFKMPGSEHGTISLADQGERPRSRSEELWLVKKNMPDVDDPAVSALYEHTAAKHSGVWVTTLAAWNGDVSKKNVTLVGTRHTDSQVAPRYREQTNWLLLQQFDRYLQTTPANKRLLLVESGSPANNYTGLVEDFKRSCDFYADWTNDIFANRRISPPDEHDPAPLQAAFAMNEMQLLRYLVIHRVDIASLHRAVEARDLSHLRFYSNDHIPMQAWDPSNEEIIRHLHKQGFEPRAIALEQTVKNIFNIVNLLPPGSKELPTQQLFENLTSACFATRWQSEEAFRAMQIFYELADMPQLQEREMRRSIDRILRELNPEMERISARLGLDFRLVNRTERGYEVSWDPRDPDQYNAIFNAPAGKLDPASTLQYASYLNIRYRHSRAVDMLHLSIAAGYEPYGQYNIIHAMPLAVAIGRATKQDINWSSCA